MVIPMSPQPQHKTPDVENAIQLTRLEEGMKHLERTMSEGFKRLEATIAARDLKHDDHERRIQKLENWRWYLVGAFGAITFAMNVAFKVFGHS